MHTLDMMQFLEWKVSFVVHSVWKSAENVSFEFSRAVLTYLI